MLFVCTHNSARSQIAEGLLNAINGERYEAYSAGIKPSRVNQFAVQVMKELGIDISKHRSKSVAEFLNMELDYVVTVCDNAKETCPFFPGGKQRLHQSFTDPSSFTGNDDEILEGFRIIRDEIKNWIEKTFS